MKINSILIGKGKGSAGNVTVVQLKGQSILKQKASIVANPRTVGQQKQRAVISRAVIVWQLIGNAIKSGWTSLKPFCSQYNTYVSENALFFKNATFDKASFQSANLVGSTATKGKLGVLDVVGVNPQPGGCDFTLQHNNLLQVAKVGDTLHALGGMASGSELAYNNIIVDQALLDDTNPLATIDLGEQDPSRPFVYAMWLTSADGKESTTSEFTQQ